MGRNLIFLFLLMILFTFNGCLTHWFIDTEVRLQIENLSPYTINTVSLSSKDTEDEKTWMNTPIAPKERSKVISKNWVGNFNLKITYQDSLLLKKHLFEDVSLEGGSVFIQISIKDGVWVLNKK